MNNGITLSTTDRLLLIGSIVVFAVMSAVAFETTLLSLHVNWTENNQTYSHGYVLLLFVAYALYTERGWLSLSPSFWAIPLGLAVALIWVAANAVQVQLIQQMMIPGLLACLLFAIVGFKNTLKAWVPILGIYLAIPVMDFFLNPLQDLTTWAVSHGVRWVGITAYIEQYDIHLPYGTLRIADGCAGLNYMLAGLTIGLFYSYLNLVRTRDYLVAISTIVIIAIVGNWIRVFALVMIGYESKMQSELVNDHGFFGWVIFAVLMVLYFIFMERYCKKIPAIESAQSTAAHPNQNTAKKASVSVLLVAVALAILPITVGSDSRNQVVAEQPIVLPDGLNQFSISNVTLKQMGANYAGADRSHVYASNVPDSMRLAIVSYFQQAQGKELIYFANKPAREVSALDTVMVDGLELNTGLSNNGQTRVFWFYQVGQQRAVSSFDTKLLQLKDALAPKPAHVVVLQIDCRRQCDLQYWSESPVVRSLSSISL